MTSFYAESVRKHTLCELGPLMQRLYMLQTIVIRRQDFIVPQDWIERVMPGFPSGLVGFQLRNDGLQFESQIRQPRTIDLDHILG